MSSFLAAGRCGVRRLAARWLPTRLLEALFRRRAPRWTPMPRDDELAWYDVMCGWYDKTGTAQLARIDAATAKLARRLL
jgi:hypothetical protein